jgi:hypothetical protein
VTANPDGEVWLPLAEAAPRLGLSRHQLRRRIRAGQIANRQVQGLHGLTYEVCLDSDATVPSASRHPDDRNGDATVMVTPPLAELVSLVRDTQTQLLQATAAAAMWQTRAEMLSNQVERLQLALEAPKEPASPERPQTSDSEGVAVEPTQTSSASPKRAPWWAPWRRATS